MPPSKHGHFHLILILPFKIVELPQQHAIANCCKELQLQYGRVPRSAFENIAMHEN